MGWRAPSRSILPVLVMACTQTPDSLETGAVSLLNPDILSPVDGRSDPLSAHRPDASDCPEAAWGPEGGGFEVQTGVCGYAAFEQPLGIEVAPGDRLEISIWHDTLDAAEPATGHVAVLLGHDVVWEDTVAIPAVSAELGDVVVVEHPIPADARLGIHLHNHGYNSWRFVTIDLLDN